MEAMIKMSNISKKFKGFALEIDALEIPKGFATALIGENGAGKSTLMNILAGVRLDYKGEVTYFDGEKNDKVIREAVGYTSPTHYFMPHWSVSDIKEVTSLLFDGFDAERYMTLCEDMGVNKESKQIRDMSDGMRMKTTLATVFARDTKMLLLDEPASPLDPLMREKLCCMIQDYLVEGDGEKSVFFSTHNISDMENVTDYCIIMAKGSVVEKGSVEELKEKYVAVKGEAADADKVKEWIIGYRSTVYGFEGLCLSENLDKLAGVDVAVETPNLSQISVAVMGQYSTLN